MITIIKQELDIDESLKIKLSYICEFANTTPTFIKGNIRKLDKTNLTYIDFNNKYIDVVNDMYQDNVLDDEDINDLDLNKEKDDFEM